MSKVKIIILLALALCIIAVSVSTLTNWRGFETKNTNVITADDPHDSTRRIHKRSATHSFSEQVLGNLEALQNSTPEKQSHLSQQLGHFLVKGLEETGSYREIRRILGEIDRSDAKRILQYHVIGAKSGRGIDADFIAQFGFIQEYVNPERRGQERFLRFFGEIRGEEGLDAATFRALSASQKYGLMEGVSSSGYASGLIQNLTNLGNDKYRAQIIDRSISIAIKKAPEDTVLEIAKLPVSPDKDELLVTMIRALEKVGAAEDAKDWIDEISDRDLRAEVQKSLRK